MMLLMELAYEAYVLFFGANGLSDPCSSAKEDRQEDPMNKRVLVPGELSS